MQQMQEALLQSEARVAQVEAQLQAVTAERDEALAQLAERSG